jgi:hypothetical protein
MLLHGLTLAVEGIVRGAGEGGAGRGGGGAREAAGGELAEGWLGPGGGAEADHGVGGERRSPGDGGLGEDCLGERVGMGWSWRDAAKLFPLRAGPLTQW